MYSTLPTAFVEELTARLGRDEAQHLCNTILHTEPSVSVRLNPAKPSAAFADCPQVEWCGTGRILAERPSFTFDPLFHAGAYYVQEAASMYLSQAPLPKTPVVALDLCAAPGGKATLLRDLLHPESILIANEVVPSRAAILVENIMKWGQQNCIVTSTQPANFLRSFAGMIDVILVDAPCSGEGMFRKDKFAIEQWSTDLIKQCANTQRSLTQTATQLLAKGGVMIYSTCTYNRYENEDIVESLAEQNYNCTMRHFYPHRTAGEGLFMAFLTDTNDAPQPQRSPSLSAVRQLLKKSGIKVLYDGTVGTDPRLCPELALSVADHAAGIPRYELDYATAIAYLRRESIVLSDAAPTGYVIVTHCGLPLGFVKNIGTRANNLYPNQWRIRSTNK